MLKTEWQSLKKGDIIYFNGKPRKVMSVTKNSGIVFDTGSFYSPHHCKLFTK